MLARPPHRPLSILVVIGLVVGLVACAGAPSDSQPGSLTADPASVGPDTSSEAALPTDAPTDVPAPSEPPDGGGIPDDAELEARYDRLLAVLAPPNSTLEARENPGQLDLGVFYMSTSSYDELVAFYDTAIPDAGLQVTRFDEPFPDDVEWDFAAGTDFVGGVSISGAEGAYRVLIALLGIPPAG